MVTPMSCNDVDSFFTGFPGSPRQLLRPYSQHRMSCHPAAERPRLGAAADSSRNTRRCKRCRCLSITPVGARSDHRILQTDRSYRANMKPDGASRTSWASAVAPRRRHSKQHPHQGPYRQATTTSQTPRGTRAQNWPKSHRAQLWRAQLHTAAAVTRPFGLGALPGCPAPVRTQLGGRAQRFVVTTTAANYTIGRL